MKDRDSRTLRILRGGSIWPLLGMVAIYRYAISPLLHLMAPWAGCRYLPTCSQYAGDALRRHGALRGGWLAFRRILDCHPWGGHGHDPVPETWPGWRFSRRMSQEGGVRKENESGARSSLPSGR